MKRNYNTELLGLEQAIDLIDEQIEFPGNSYHLDAELRARVIQLIAKTCKKQGGVSRLKILEGLAYYSR